MADPGRRTVRRIHGYSVGSMFDLEGVDDRCPAVAADIEIEQVNDLAAPSTHDRPVLSYDFGHDRYVRASMDESGAVNVEFSAMSRFRISSDQDRIEFTVRPSGSLGEAVVLLQGWVMAMTVMLRGGVVLHASAVDTDGMGLAFLADSGMGKSTVTAMGLRDGATLVSDDVLRVEETSGGAVVAYPGLTAIRLRPSAGDLAPLIPGVTVGETVDGRVLARVERGDADPVALHAVFVPLPSRTAKRLDVKWLDPAIAAVELNHYPRVYDWQISGPQRSQFELTSKMATSLPVGLLSIPWGPPWPDGFLDDVLGLLTDRVG